MPQKKYPLQLREPAVAWSSTPSSYWCPPRRLPPDRRPTRCLTQKHRPGSIRTRSMPATAPALPPLKPSASRTSRRRIGELRRANQIRGLGFFRGARPPLRVCSYIDEHKDELGVEPDPRHAACCRRGSSSSTDDAQNIDQPRLANNVTRY